MRRLASWSAGLAATAWALPAPAAHMPALCGALGISRRLALGPGAVGLTFDDGPHPEGTPAVLSALASAGVAATFFVVGEQLRRDPGPAREALAAGHRLAVHGDRHRAQVRVGPRALREDLDRCAALVESLTQARVALYRPPFGIFSASGLAEVRRRGWTPLLWSRWARDWRAGATPPEIARRAGAQALPGDVLLLHDADHYCAPGSWRSTAAALPILLDVLHERGLHAVPV